MIADVEVYLSFCLEVCGEGLALVPADGASRTLQAGETPVDEGDHGGRAFGARDRCRDDPLERHAAALRDEGVTVKLEDEAALLAIELPKSGDLGPANDAAGLLERLASYERWSGILWIGLGMLQCLTHGCKLLWRNCHEP